MSDQQEFDIREVANRHINSTDKLYRMCAGLSSDLVSYEDQTIELAIRVTRRWPKSHEVTALQLAESWRREPELSQARGYVVHIYRSERPVGLSVPVPTGSADGPSFPPRREWLEAVVAALKAMQGPSTDVLVATVRGDFSASPHAG